MTKLFVFAEKLLDLGVSFASLALLKKHANLTERWSYFFNNLTKYVSK